MRVWLLHIGEQLPVDGAMRMFRYGYLARAIQEAGHEVLQWAPTFCHVKKTHRFSTDHRVTINDSYTIQLVHSPGYRRNVGLERLRTYRVLGQRFRELAHHEPRPDIIVAAIPSLEWAEAAVDYGRARGVPVVVDIRDRWPDVFLSAVPGTARPLARLALRTYRRIAERACRKADALVAISQRYLDWGLTLAGRNQHSLDRVLPIGYEPMPVSVSELRENVAKLRNLGIDPTRPTCFFAGGLVRHHDVATIVEAARLIELDGRHDVQFIICGDGIQKEELHRRAAGLRQVHFLGWVEAAMLQAAASISSIGLCAYAKGSTLSIGNKPFEYMAGRLAILSSLNGDLAELLERHKCGFTYRAGDAESLGRCIIQLVDDRDHLEVLRANGYEAWRNCYRSTQVYGRFVDLLTSLVVDRPRPHDLAKERRLEKPAPGCADSCSTGSLVA